MAVTQLGNPRTAQQPDGRQYGPRKAFVRDRRDPELRGRVRVWCPSLIAKDVPGNWSDWCERKGVFHAVPPLGAAVWVEYEMGNVQNPVYSWGWARGDSATSSEVPAAGKGETDPAWAEEKEVEGGGFGVSIHATLPADPAVETPPEYPYNKVFTSEGGHSFELDDSPEGKRAVYRHPSGTSVTIDADGNVQIRSVGGQYHECGGDFVVALKAGSTFKVIYPQGAGLSVGGSGVSISGHQAQILGRTLIRGFTGI
jgi:hypothetical protein